MASTVNRRAESAGNSASKSAKRLSPATLDQISGGELRLDINTSAAHPTLQRLGLFLLFLIVRKRGHEGHTHRAKGGSGEGYRRRAHREGDGELAELEGDSSRRDLARARGGRCARLAAVDERGGVRGHGRQRHVEEDVDDCNLGLAVRVLEGDAHGRADSDEDGDVGGAVEDSARERSDVGAALGMSMETRRTHAVRARRNAPGRRARTAHTRAGEMATTFRVGGAARVGKPLGGDGDGDGERWRLGFPSCFGGGEALFIGEQSGSTWRCSCSSFAKS